MLQPSVPYAWQLVGERLELASTHGRRQNVLGFFNLHHEFHSFAFEGSIDTHTVIHCFDLFNQRRKKSALVVIDNALIHTSDLARGRDRTLGRRALREVSTTLLPGTESD